MSTSKSKICRRALIIYGRGPAAALGLSFPALFSTAGFETRIVLLPESQGWIGEEALRTFSHGDPLTETMRPGWAQTSSTFDLTVLLGLSPGTVQDLLRNEPHHPLLQNVCRSGGTISALFNPPAPLSAPFSPDDTSSLLFWNHLPENPAEGRHVCEKIFAQLIGHLEASRKTQGKTFRCQRSLPEVLEKLAPTLARWQKAFERELRILGFSTAQADQPPDLFVELHDGPFLSASRGKNRWTCTLEPTVPKISPGRKGNLHFLPFLTSETLVADFIAAGITVAIRQPSEDILLMDAKGTRLLPDLEEQPALQRLARLISAPLTANG